MFLPRPSSPRTEVFGAGDDGLAQDDLRPLVVQELGVPPGFAQLVEHGTPLPECLALVERLLGASGLGLAYDAQRELIDVADLHARQQLLAAQLEQS